MLQDHQAFRRKNWRYLILDEAQNIKNFKSQRWQSLLNFNRWKWRWGFMEGLTWSEGWDAQKVESWLTILPLNFLCLFAARDACS